MSQPSRVLMTADALGGVWTYALELVRALPETEFALCTMGGALSPAQRAEVRQLKNAVVFVSPYKLEWMEEPWDEVDAAGRWLLEIATHFRPDLIHLNGYAHAVLPWRVPVLVVAHSCVLSWWRAVKHTRAPARFRHYRDRVVEGLAAASLVIAPSCAMRDALCQNYPGAFQVRVIYNGRDSSTFKIGSKIPRVLAAGRVWDEAKNLQTLDGMAPFIKWPIEIAGEILGPNGKEMVLRRASALGKLDRVDLARKLAASAIFALPARYEPFGFAVLEAAFSGCALVLGDIPSLRELWRDAALFVEPDDSAGLVAALNELISDEALRRDLSRRAHDRSSQFSLDQMAAEYRAVYAACSASELTEAA